MCNMMELSGLFMCLGGLIKFFSAWGTEEITGLWFAMGKGRDQYPGWHYEFYYLLYLEELEKAVRICWFCKKEPK